MSALIKIKELEIDEFMFFKKIKNTFIVIPHIISYSNNLSEYRAIIQRRNIKELDIDEQYFNEKSSFDRATVPIYIVNYIDSTNTKKTINFQHKRDAEKFLSELKLCINEFYSNADAYVKFIN